MIKVAAEKREFTGKKARKQIATGQLVGVAFGPKFESTSIQVNYKDFDKTFKNVGFSKLLDLEVEGNHFKAVVKELQIHPVKRTFIHVSLYVVDMEKEIEANIPVEVIGMAPAVKNNLGFLEVPANTISVKCLPADLPAAIVVDVNKLEQVGNAVTLADLNLGDKVHFTGTVDSSFRVAFIAAPQKVVEEVEATTTAEATTEGTEGETAEAAKAE